MYTKRRSLILLLCPTLCCLAQERTYKVGDRIEAHDIGWYKGAITQLGTGTNQGMYMVKYDDFSTQRWFRPSDLRPGGPPEAPKTYPVYKMGESVEGYDFGWHAATVTEIGSGAHQGQYLLKYAKFSTSRWYSPKDMRAAGAGEAEKASDTAATAQGPRLGKYNIYAYGAAGTGPLYLGHLGHLELLAGGKYRVSRSSSGSYFGEGAYTFDGKSIQWTSGPYATTEWAGGFSVESKTHRIGLRSRTVATNTAP